MKKKRSLCLLLSVLIATAYLIYIAQYFLSGADTTAGAISTMLVLPHIVILLIGVILGWISWVTRGTGFALASSILYCVSAVVFVMYAIFLVPSIILGFIGFARQKKLNSI